MLIDQMPRSSLLWLLAVQVALIAPHAQHLPVWLLGVWALVMFWRWQMYRGLWRAPGALEKALLVAACCGAIIAGYSRWFALEPMVALLVAAFILKFVEMRLRRDLRTVLFLGFFITATQFLFASGIFASLYGLFCVLLLLAALISVQQCRGDSRRAFRLGVSMLMWSLPLMLVVFVFAPRFGALWAVPSAANAAKTGVSDSMSPGDFARLSKSDEVAFRVSFSGTWPAASARYWRGLVFSVFDGRSWYPAQTHTEQLADSLWRGDGRERWQSVELLAQRYDYELIMESTQQYWLYSLAVASRWPQGVGLDRNVNLHLKRRLSERRRFVLQSRSARVAASGLSQSQYWRETQLPEQGNPRARRQALRWLREANGSAAQYIERVLAEYQRSFTYTLQPPALGANSVDEFLFDSKRGFCEHFAGSFVFLMRAAGIPARVVAGYQGGERNSQQNYLIVRQRDAHAWAEVWLRGRGWQRVDPTAAVSPLRIEQGVEQALPAEMQLLNNSFGGRLLALGWVKSLQLKWDAANYRWQQLVMDFDDSAQQGLLRRWLGGLEPWRVLLGLMIASALIGAPLALRLWLGQRSPARSPADRCWQQLEKRLSRLGFIRAPAETPQQFAERIAEARPSWRTALLSIAALYGEVVYASKQGKLPALQQRIRHFRP